MKFAIRRAQLLKWFCITLLAVAQIATYYALTRTDRFYVKKQQLLEDPEFVKGNTHWKRQGSGWTKHNGRIISLVNEEIGSQTLTQKVLSLAPGHYAISFEASTRIVSGATPNGRAEVTLIYRDQFDQPNGHRDAIILKPSTVLAPRHMTIRIDQAVESVDVSIRFLHAEGVFSISDLTFSFIAELPLYKKIKYLALFFWSMVLLTILALAYRIFTSLHTFFLASAFSVTFVLLLLPATSITYIGLLIDASLPTPLAERIGSTLQQTVEFNFFSLPKLQISTLGHITLFLIMGLLTGTKHKTIGLVFSLFSLVLFASLTEVLQLVVVGRSATISDLKVDCAAAVIGMGIGIYFSNSLEKRNYGT